MTFTEQYQSILTGYEKLLDLEKQFPFNSPEWENTIQELFKNLGEFINDSFYLEPYRRNSWWRKESYKPLIKIKLDKENLSPENREIFANLTNFFDLIGKTKLQNFLSNLDKEKSKLKDRQYNLLLSPEIKEVFWQPSGLQ